ncbi:MAG: NAD(+)/NADH kinase [Coriobacteriales bacterium]|nr:NAD(+)/NADH kinase [Coriobacteriales bacterium]
MNGLITKILIVSHPKKEILDASQSLAARLNIAGFETHIIANFDDELDVSLDEIALCISMGGDGTILRAARLLHFGNCTILPLGHGHLSFLACPKDGKDEIELIADCLSGEVPTYNPHLLYLQIFNDSNDQSDFYALNDFSITRENNAQVLRFKYYFNDTFVQESIADGFVVSTALGSTGYGLSSGGPIINPTNNGFVFNQIAPHTLANRAIVTGPSDVLTVAFDKSSACNAQLSIDGRVFEHGCIHNIVVQKCQCELKLARPSYDFYDKVRNSFF